MKKGFIIAIDGPVGSGKGTCAKGLAKSLQAFFLTTGMFYRAAALYCLENNIDFRSEEAVTKILQNIHIDVDGDKTLLNGKDVTLRLREKDIDQTVGITSNYQSVRDYLIPQQRLVGETLVEKGDIIIAEGRDIATKVFPHAEIKIYLTAQPEARAQRRLTQLQNMGIPDRTFDEVLDDIHKRDQHDMHGGLGYLVAEPEKHGYTVVDTTNNTEEQTLEEILTIVKEKGLI